MDEYVIKLYDSCDKQWIQISGKLSITDAMKQLSKLTENGTKYTKQIHDKNKRGDYYMYFKVNNNFMKIKKISSK